MRSPTPRRDEMTASQAAKALGGVSRQRIQQYRKEGRLRGRATPLGWLYDARSIERLAQALRKNARSLLGKGVPA